ncbi:MAG: hypothetical protein Q7R68_09320 [Nitrospirales bacterium]|nr:hypothetical protein [Nitrospirales bacterium]
MRSDFTRREVCRGLGLVGAAILLGGCQGAALLDPAPKDGEVTSYPDPVTPEQFEVLVGTVQSTRAKAALAADAPLDFMRRFVSFSPRILAAKRPGGVIGSVLVNPVPTAVELAVNLQMARERMEPALLHDDLGRMAAKQYWRFRNRYFVATVPNTVNLFGDSIHKNRYLLQMVVSGDLPPEKVVQTNQDMESLLGRQISFARLMVNGLSYGRGGAPIRRNDIWLDDQEGQKIPDGTVSVTLVINLIRLEMTGSEVRAISPVASGERPQTWNQVSAVYHNFAVGQMIEAERAVALYMPRNVFEQGVVNQALREYRSRLIEVKKSLNWDEAHAEAYESQKHSKVDLLTQQVFLDI